MKKRFTYTLLLLSLGFAAQAQEVTFEEPRKLPEVLNSEAEETQPILTPDGNTLYFVRSFHEENTGGKLSGHDIWFSTKTEDGSWSKAEKMAKKFNNERNNAVVGINADGSRIYLMDAYHALKSGEKGISYADLKNGQWGKILSESIDGLNTENGYIGFYMHPAEDVLIISMSDERSQGTEDLYVSLKNEKGEWQEVRHMGQVINSEGYEIAPFLSEDKQTLYFTSNGFGGLGDADIFKATRLDESWTNWSAPENLGSPVNSSAFDGYFFMSPENKIFFASNRDGKFSDLYSTAVKPDEEVLMASAEEMPAEVKEEMPAAPVKPEPTADELFTESFQTIVVYFDFDSHELSEEAKNSLAELIEGFAPTQDIKLVVTGHTDQMGPETYNLKLSEKRAKSVADFLQAKGVSAQKLSTIAKGEKAPAVESTTLEQRKKNRRVEIRID